MLGFNIARTSMRLGTIETQRWLDAREKENLSDGKRHPAPSGEAKDDRRHEGLANLVLVRRARPRQGKLGELRASGCQKPRGVTFE